MPGVSVISSIFPAPRSIASGLVLPAVSVYAASMALTAAVSNAASVTRHAVPTPPPPAYAPSLSYIIPFTSAHGTPIAAPVIGLVPMFPSISDVGTFVIPDFDKITKLPDVPRFTVAGLDGEDGEL